MGVEMNLFKKSVILTSVLSLFLLGPKCDNSDPVDPGTSLTPGDYVLTKTLDSLDRVYNVHVPASYTGKTAVPLVIDIHGYQSSGESQKKSSGFLEKSDAVGFIVVWPEGIDSTLGQSWNAGSTCCGKARDDGVDDVGFILFIVNDIKTRANINAKRVYVTGHSNGAGLTQRLGIVAADVFAAIAPMSMVIEYQDEAKTPITSISPSRPITVIEFHGLNDNLIGYDSTFWGPTVQETYRIWAAANGCTGESQLITTWEDGSKYETYANCNAGVTVTLVSTDTGHNDIRGFTPKGGTKNTADMAWEVLSQHTLP
jgi:polyhydroxybutyrate depolymerase